MTTAETTTTQPTNPRRWPWIAGIVAALFVGLLIGGAAAGTEPVAVETPEPETIVETVVETETVTEVVEATPGVCLIAMESADEIMEVTAEVFDIVSDVAHDVGAILNADGYLITAEWNVIDDQAAGRMEPLQDKLSAAMDEYVFASLACELLAEED